MSWTSSRSFRNIPLDCPIDTRNGMPIRRRAIWIHFLALLLFFAVWGGAFVWAQEIPQSEEPLIKPPIEERKISEARIDSESLEVGLYGGIYALEGFSTSSMAFEWLII